MPVIVQLLYLKSQGESFTRREATDVFFSATKLFQHQDRHLRRMVYLLVKEFVADPDEVIIIISSLMKDMNSPVDLYRSNSLRVLCSLIDGSLLQQVERYIKQSIVDRNPAVASAALVSAYKLAERGNMEIIKRWAPEITERVSSEHPAVQYHAICLLHALRQGDRLAVSKLVAGLQRAGIRAPLPSLLHVRYVADIIRDSQPGTQGEPRPYFDFLEASLRHRSEMVIFEAARSITQLQGASLQELQPAIIVLQMFLSSPRPVLRFATARALSRVAARHPEAVAPCNVDLEGLVSDPNRSIATLAITTLLKTGTESSVDRLLKQITGLMGDISDDFKVVVVQAIKVLCLKFPQKYRSLMAFLAAALREEGGFEFKRAIVESILALIEAIPEAKEPGLAHLCEFIEDCEFPYLSTQILHLLGEEAPKTSEPSRYTRFMYNRVILENATVRAAAVSALFKLGRAVETVRDSVMTLLRRALHDTDDEVRDRAALSLHVLDRMSPELLHATATRKLPLDVLESRLVEYLETGAEHPFDLETIPEAEAQTGAASLASVVRGVVPMTALEIDDVPAAAPARAAEAEEASAAAAAQAARYAETLSGVPELRALGQVLKSSPEVQLLEEGMEYKVGVVKHVFADAVLLHFRCYNTIKEQVLENVRVVVDLSGAESFAEDFAIPLAAMPLEGEGEAGSTFVCLKKGSGEMATGSVGCSLSFTLKEVDPVSGDVEDEGYEDEYVLEELDISAADYIKDEPVANFRMAWEALPGESEVAEEYGLGSRDSLEEAVQAVKGALGMRVCEGSDLVPITARSHTLLLSGSVVGQARCMARIKFGVDGAGQVAIHVTARADTLEVSQLVHDIITS